MKLNLVLKPSEYIQCYLKTGKSLVDVLSKCKEKLPKFVYNFIIRRFGPIDQIEKLEVTINFNKNIIVIQIDQDGIVLSESEKVVYSFKIKEIQQNAA